MGASDADFSGYYVRGDFNATGAAMKCLSLGGTVSDHTDELLKNCCASVACSAMPDSALPSQAPRHHHPIKKNGSLSSRSGLTIYLNYTE